MIENLKLYSVRLFVVTFFFLISIMWLYVPFGIEPFIRFMETHAQNPDFRLTVASYHDWLEADSLRGFIDSDRGKLFVHLVGFFFFMFACFFLLVDGTLMRSQTIKREVSDIDAMIYVVTRFTVSLMFVFAFPFFGLLFFSDALPATNGEYLRPYDYTYFLVDQFIRAMVFDFSEIFDFSVAREVEGFSESFIENDTFSDYFLIKISFFFYRMSVEFYLLYLLYNGIRRSADVTS